MIFPVFLRFLMLLNAVTGRVEELQDMAMEQKKQYTLGSPRSKFGEGDIE